jgi:hypothetical protein
MTRERIEKMGPTGAIMHYLREGEVNPPKSTEVKQFKDSCSDEEWEEMGVQAKELLLEKWDKEHK